MFSSFFYNIATFLYVGSIFSHIFNLWTRAKAIKKFALSAVAFGFIIQTLGMLARWIEAGQVELLAAERSLNQSIHGWHKFILLTQHPPWSNLYEIMVYMSWGMVLVGLLSYVHWRSLLVHSFSLVFALFALGLASLTDAMIKPLVPALKSWWIMIHVISASIAYSCGTLAAIAGFVYLLKVKEKFSLTQLGLFSSILLSGTALILGRGLTLFISGNYYVKLLVLANDHPTIVHDLSQSNTPAVSVASPGAGIFLIVTLVMGLITLGQMYRERYSYLPTGLSLAVFAFSTLCGWAFLAMNVMNNLLKSTIALDPSHTAHYSPQGQWQLGAISNHWDLALWSIVISIHTIVLLSFFFHAQWNAHLPEAKKLDDLVYTSVLIAFALMGIVLMTGSLWAHYAWGRYWAWDPKETGALIIWLVYALYLHTRLNYGSHRPQGALIAIAGFFVILAGFLGVNLGWFADGLHGYGSS